MSAVFKDSVIYVFSPQPWQYLQISKHHYARELAKENRVYFVTPPLHGNRFSFSVNEEKKNLFVLSYTLAVPGFLRFKFPSIYKQIIRIYMSHVLRTGLPPADVAFDFGCYQQFDSMNFIKARHKIFFPVDDFETLKPDDRGADLVLTVSKNIQAKFPVGKCHFINHGLAEEFSKKALSHTSPWVAREVIKAGCSGNLFIRFLDTEILRKLIENHPAVEFHFFGSHEANPSVPWQVKWKGFLLNSPNVRLHGILSTYDLVEAYDEIDVFLLCYKPDYVNYHGENSHKVLEYLSTGRVLVSTHLTIYSNTDLFEMTPFDENEKLLEIFSKVIASLQKYNSENMKELRVKFALNNTYGSQLSRIRNLISNGV